MTTAPRRCDLELLGPDPAGPDADIPGALPRHPHETLPSATGGRLAKVLAILRVGWDIMSQSGKGVADRNQRSGIVRERTTPDGYGRCIFSV